VSESGVEKARRKTQTPERATAAAFS